MKKKKNEILTDIRKEYKLSRKALEDISGFKARTIESYERGEREPSKEYIEFISLYFGYKKEYIEGKEVIQRELNEEIGTILMFKSIYNYDNEKMADLLGIDIEDYINIFNILDDLSKQHESLEITNEKHLSVFENLPYHEVRLKMIKHYFDIYIYFALKLNIKLQCFSSQFENNLHLFFVENKGKRVNDRKGWNPFITFLIYDTPIYAQLEKNFENGIDITPKYYASIIKKRNSPEPITPITQTETIPNKYKEVLDLLPYASDNFLQNLKKKLLSIKEAQQVEDL